MGGVGLNWQVRHLTGVADDADLRRRRCPPLGGQRSASTSERTWHTTPVGTQPPDRRHARVASRLRPYAATANDPIVTARGVRVQVPPPTLFRTRKPCSEAMRGPSSDSPTTSSLHQPCVTTVPMCRSSSSDTGFVGWRPSVRASAPLNATPRANASRLREWLGSARPCAAPSGRNSSSASVAETVRPADGVRIGRASEKAKGRAGPRRCGSARGGHVKPSICTSASIASSFATRAQRIHVWGYRSCVMGG
jgi:hypothetical protein